MTSQKPRTIPYRRKREGKTDYLKRLKLLPSRKLRLVVRFSNRKVIGQIVEFSSRGDIVKIGVSSDKLRASGWTKAASNVPAAYLTGLLLGKKAIAIGINEAILDTGFKKPFRSGRIYAFLKGALDAGLKIPHGEKNIFPSEGRISGEQFKNNLQDEFLKTKKAIEG